MSKLSLEEIVERLEERLVRIEDEVLAAFNRGSDSPSVNSFVVPLAESILAQRKADRGDIRFM